MVDEDFTWRLAQELVRIDSSDPGAYEGELERFVKALVEERMAQLSHPVLDAVQIEELEVLPGRRNLMVTVPGLSDEPRLVYICHMDTVTLGDGWDAGIPPLGAIVRDAKLYGRGACNMKGGLAWRHCRTGPYARARGGEWRAAPPWLLTHLFGRRGGLYARLRGGHRRPAGSARANGYWTPSLPMDRFRWRTRDAHGSRLR